MWVKHIFRFASPVVALAALSVLPGIVRQGEAQQSPAQQEKGAGDAASMGARELYYVTLSKRDSLPSASRKDSLPAAHRAGAETSAAATSHLGLRYNLLLFDRVTRTAQPVNSTHIFHNHDCVVIDLQANHSGYVYVLAKESSGGWSPLLPSPEDPEDTSVLDPGSKKRIPNSNYCMEISDPPGVETLFVVLSRSPADFAELYRGIRGAPKQDVAPRTPAPAQALPLQIADASLVNDAVEKMSQQFGTRDIMIRRASEPVGSDEPRGAVYVVNSSAKPSATITTTIEIRHR